jgi:hypothetical protein
MDRREFLVGLSAIPFVGNLFAMSWADADTTPIPVREAPPADPLLDRLEAAFLAALAKHPAEGINPPGPAQWVVSALIKDDEIDWSSEQLSKVFFAPCVCSMAQAVSWQPAYRYPGNQTAVSGSLHRVVWYNHCPFGLTVVYDGAKQGHIVSIVHFTGWQ